MSWQLAGIVKVVGSACELPPRMTNDEEAFDPTSPLTAPEIVMLVEALDALLPSQEGRRLV